LARDIGLGAEGNKLFVFAKNSIDVVAARTDQEISGGKCGWRDRIATQSFLFRGQITHAGDNVKAGGVNWRATLTDNVRRLGLDSMDVNGLLLVPICVHVHAALLSYHIPIMFRRMKRISAEVCFHSLLAR
jgi:hypothetical protein